MSVILFQVAQFHKILFQVAQFHKNGVELGSAIFTLASFANMLFVLQVLQGFRNWQFADEI